MAITGFVRPYLGVKQRFPPLVPSRVTEVGSRMKNDQRMKKDELARRLAVQEAVTPAAAADHLDDLIFAVLKKLKQGKSAAFPGLGPVRKVARPAKADPAK